MFLVSNRGCGVVSELPKATHKDSRAGTDTQTIRPQRVDIPLLQPSGIFWTISTITATRLVSVP